MKALSLTIHEICPTFKFSRNRSNFKVKRAKMKVPERSCHSFMNIIIIHMISSYIFGNREENLIHFHYLAIMALPQGLKPWPRRHEFHNLGRQLYGHHNHA
jgi:hypothetical protein